MTICLVQRVFLESRNVVFSQLKQVLENNQANGKMKFYMFCCNNSSTTDDCTTIFAMIA